MSTELVSRLEVAGYDVKSHFVMRWLFFYFVLLPGLRPSAVSVGCSTSTEGLVLQDAFAYGVLTNRLTPLGYVRKDRKLPVKKKSHFDKRWLFCYYEVLPGLRPLAVSVSCSTLADGLVSQDAFAWDVLTNRLTPLGYVSSGQRQLLIPLYKSYPMADKGDMAVLDLIP